MKNYFSSGAMLLALQLLGCTVDVQQTENGVAINIECASSSSDDQPSDEEPGIEDPSAEDPGIEEPDTADPATDDPSSDDGADALPENG